MYEHLRKWETQLDATTSARLDLWDTGRTRDGKSELRYALAIIPDSVDDRVVIIEGEEFWPSPLHAIDSDETAAALLDFMAHGGETSEPPVTLKPRQLETLQRYHEELSLWAFELEKDEEPELTACERIRQAREERV